MKKVFIHWDGCNRRFLELTRIKKYLVENGFEVVAEAEAADIIFAATCAFKEKEENNSVANIEKFKKYDKKLIIYGCLPEIAPSKFEKYLDYDHMAPKDLERIDQVFDNIQVPLAKVTDANLIQMNSQSRGLKSACEKVMEEFELSRDFFEWTLVSARKAALNFKKSNRSYYLFINRGCQGKCSYCGIKFAVGKVKSKPIAAVIDEFKTGLAKGYKNFVLLGDDLGAYGVDNHSTLPDLLTVLVAEARMHENGTAGRSNSAPKLWLKEVHPKWIVRYQHQLVELARSQYIFSILCPIQSGSDRILDLMNREHATADFYEAWEKIQQANSAIQWTTQMMIGFPSETEADLEATLNLITRMRFDSVVIFPYHDKERTASSRIKEKISQNVIDRRVKRSKRHLRKKGIKVYMKCPPD